MSPRNDKDCPRPDRRKSISALVDTRRSTVSPTTSSPKPRRARPFGVTVLSVWEVLVGLQLLLVGLAVWAWSSVQEPGSPLASLALLLGMAYLILGMSCLWLARGYWLGRESARRHGRRVAVLAILVALLAAISILPGSLGPDSPFWSIVGNLVVFLYLGSQTAVRYFK